jgi:hypothetical protein
MFHRIALAIAFCFAASPAFAENVLVIVDLQMQTMHVRVDGSTKYRWDVSTGRRGFSTPPGRYEPIRMHRRYFSRKYENAPMPYAIFFYGGYAIHGTTDLRNLGRVASHGCVRLHPDNAATLFALVEDVGIENTVIRVRSHGAMVARLDEREVAEPQPIEPAVAIETNVEITADTLTTGSTEAMRVGWMRPGLNS